ncbi:hypothetical protein GCM10011452_23110 [Gemmobacter lanyuensis]|uniref:Uncharacterized protein n=1 Tax=Gemmobacter lanyuensis TaxID=1054497 RepID=A0A918IVH4_9RHOB|nr:hypothetical protein [Gemmobacter lanyuensis]GGW33913.1 hypothetical protein GCM10011452_23110 [Gemmobacter lanyuensis]
MLEHLPQEIVDGLYQARERKARRSRLRVQLGEAVFPVLGLTETTLTLDAARTPKLRGLVDVFDGARHILQGLIVATRVEAGQLVCEFKRSTLVLDAAPLDYERDESRPVGYLPRN